MWLWLASGLIPVLGLVYALTRFSDISEHLKAAARAADPTASVETISRISSVTALTGLLALAVPVILQIMLALLMINRHGWPRYFLIIVGLVGVPAAAVAFGALSDESTQTQNNAEIGVAVQTVLVLLAIVLMFLPTANSWFRTKH